MIFFFIVCATNKLDGVAPLITDPPPTGSTTLSNLCSKHFLLHFFIIVEQSGSGESCVTNGLTTPVFKEVMASHLCLPSPACQPILGQPVGHRGTVIGPYRDELNCSRLTGDSWRTRHDSLKVVLNDMCNKAQVPVDCDVFGLLQDLIPAELAGPGGELQYVRQRNGLCPDLKLRLPSADGPRDSLGELKFISAGVTWYPIGSRVKAVETRAKTLPGTYCRPLERLDNLHHGRPEGGRDRTPSEMTPVVWGPPVLRVKARVAHLCRATGRQESKYLLAEIVGRYRRLVSTCATRASAMCTLARVGEITLAAKAAAGRWQVAMRLEQEMRQEAQAQWMAGLHGTGWAQRVRCHGF